MFFTIELYLDRASEEAIVEVRARGLCGSRCDDRSLAAPSNCGHHSFAHESRSIRLVRK